jgi:L-ascorbate metabolism protein UlaG (beta-lactamase superfamily)
MPLEPMPAAGDASGWGVPEERCSAVKPGDAIQVKDVKIIALDSFDRTVLDPRTAGMATLQAD